LVYFGTSIVFLIGRIQFLTLFKAEHELIAKAKRLELPRVAGNELEPHGSLRQTTRLRFSHLALFLVAWLLRARRR
jgi:hypothetical protein